ncbi:hypothetical protein [Streptomyces sp. NPDC001787]|uniref:hypothetical protein n=1 Tax=Streptomyces sp. NPDC001787 TaxID=3154523 RepID=UPI00332C15DC
MHAKAGHFQERRASVSLLDSVREQISIFLATRSAVRLIRREIGLSGGLSIQALVDHVALKRGKPITLTEAPLPPQVSGFCARGRDRDYIVVDAGASELTRRHSSLHELFHLWKEHPTEHSAHQSVTEDVVRQLLPGLNPGPVVQVLTRSHYHDDHERRAEAFATVMLDRYLQLTEDQQQTGLVTSALSHRRSGV